MKALVSVLFVVDTDDYVDSKPDFEFVQKLVQAMQNGEADMPEVIRIRAAPIDEAPAWLTAPAGSYPEGFLDRIDVECHLDDERLD